MDMKLLVRALDPSEKKHLRDLLKEEAIIDANVPTEVSNLINAGDLRTASRRLMAISTMDLVEADATCRAYHKNLPKWRLTYVMHIDEYTLKPTEDTVTKTVQWHAINQDVVTRRFRDSWRHLPDGSVTLEVIQKV
jgi:hypothetical protein